jgi:hypothetical protein
LKELNERLNSRRLRGFKKIELGSYHALSRGIFTQLKGHMDIFEGIH